MPLSGDTTAPTHLLPVIFRLDGVNSRARSCFHDCVEFGILAEPTRVAEEGVLLIVVDGPGSGMKKVIPREKL